MITLKQIINIGVLSISLIVGHIAKAQKMPERSTSACGPVWTNTVMRNFYIDTNGKDTTTLCEVLCNKVLDSSLKAYTNNYGEYFTVEMSPRMLRGYMFGEYDDEILDKSLVAQTVVVVRDYKYTTVKSYRLLEDWSFDTDNGVIKIKIKGIAPVQRLYDANNHYFGDAPIFWVEYEDAKPIIDTYCANFKSKGFYKQLWASFSISPFSNTNMQNGVTSKTVNMYDTVDYFLNRKRQIVGDYTLLTELLITASLKHGLIAYDWHDYYSFKPLKGTIKDVLYVKPDTLDFSTCDDCFGSNIVYRDFDYSQIRQYIVTQNVQFDIDKGECSIQIAGLIPQKEVHSKDEKPNTLPSHESMCLYKYTDIKDIVNEYSKHHPFCNLPLELWRGYFTE